MNSLASAIQQIRKRLDLSQADLAKRLACQQNAVSKYQSGKVQPGKDVLVRLWAIADDAERRLITAYLYEQFSFLSQPEKPLFLESALSLPHQRHFSIEVAEALGRPEAPEVLREIVSLYLKFRNRRDVEEIFRQASTWMSLQFQMRDYADQKAGSSQGTTASSTGMPDYVERELREAASEGLPEKFETRSEVMRKRRVKP